MTTIETPLTTLHQGDARDVLLTLADESVQTVVTSPPYWGLRDYGVDGQIGLEPTPELYVENMVSIFREVRRVLRSDGTLWLNLGDSYAAGGTGGASDKSRLNGGRGVGVSEKIKQGTTIPRTAPEGFKPKDLVGIPWRLAFALQADGWYLRSDIIWSKPNPMPESVTDRPTKAHEYIFLLTKSAKYYYDAEAIREPQRNMGRTQGVPTGWDTGPGSHGSIHRNGRGNSKAPVPITKPVTNRNKRSVWEIPTQPYSEAHFATFPEALVRPCILAGTSEAGVVLDPFAGSGTTLAVATSLGRKSIGIELSDEYIEIARKRITKQTPALPMGLFR